MMDSVTKSGYYLKRKKKRRVFVKYVVCKSMEGCTYVQKKWFLRNDHPGKARPLEQSLDSTIYRIRSLKIRVVHQSAMFSDSSICYRDSSNIVRMSPEKTAISLWKEKRTLAGQAQLIRMIFHVSMPSELVYFFRYIAHFPWSNPSHFAF